MFRKASTDQPRVGLSESGALSHVYIQHPPLVCSIPGARGLYYDGGIKCLLSPSSNEVFSWKTGLLAPLDPPNSDPIDEGPIVSIKYSLDGKLIGIQRSNHEIQIKNRQTGGTFSQRCKTESESILGFFWTDCPTCDVVFVKTSGLDMFSYDSELNALHLVESKRLNVSWYVYTHESRMLILASGMQCKLFSAFQFSFGGIIRLPKFEMTMAKTEANKKPVLAAEDVNIVTIYGRIFCLQLDRIGMLLHMYRFYRDAVVQQGSLPIYSNKIAVSVVDNVLLVHQVDAKVVILYDIFADSRAPISAPLPLLLRGLPKTIASSSRTSSEQTVNVETDETSGYEGSIYGDSWTFLNPDLVCDTAHGTLWRIHLDLEAIAASSSQVPSVLEFLQRRRMEASKAKNLCLAIVRTVILERRPVPMISKAIDVLVSSYSYSIRVGNSLQGGARGTHSVNPVSGGGEMTPASSIQNMGSSQAMINEPNSKVQIHGKSVIEESMGGVENEPRQILSRDVENEPLDCNEVSTMNRLSACSVSDFEENVNMESVKNNAREPLENSLSSDLHGLGAKGESKCRTRAETSDADVERSLSPSEILEHGGRPMNSNVSSQQESQVACVAISPDEMYNFVFAPVEEEMAGDPIYLVAVIIEYFRSTALEKLKVHPNLYVMTIQLLARNERYAELGLFIINKILEPSKEVALQLLESGRQNVQTRKLGMDMLRQLSLHHDYVLMLVQDGYYLDALRYARKYKLFLKCDEDEVWMNQEVSTIRASLFLEAALASNNSQHLAAVLRFFSDFIPGFKNTSDHSTYCHILNEMSCSVSA